MTDDEKTTVVTELVGVVGPILNGHRTETVINVLAVLFGDVLCCFPPGERLDVATQITARSLRMSEKLEASGLRDKRGTIQ